MGQRGFFQGLYTTNPHLRTPGVHFQSQVFTLHCCATPGLDVQKSSGATSGTAWKGEVETSELGACH